MLSYKKSMHKETPLRFERLHALVKKKRLFVIIISKIRIPLNASSWTNSDQLPFRVSIHHLRYEKRNGNEMRPAMVSGIVTEDAPVSYWPTFSLSLVTVPEVLATVNPGHFEVLSADFMSNLL